MARPWGIAKTLALIVLLASMPAAIRAQQAAAASTSCAVLVRDLRDDTFERARAAVEAAGVRRMQLFPPEAIFARFPVTPDPSLFADLAVELVFEPGGLSGKGLDIVVETALGALLGGRPAALGEAAPFDPGPIDDIVIEAPPDLVRAATPPGPRLGSPQEMVSRGPTQNAEFLIGSVLVNVVFPDSKIGTEDWTDAEIAGAITDMSLGIQQYLDRATWLRLSFTYNYKDYRRVPVSMEPIETEMVSHPAWIGEALKYIGYDYGSYLGSHALNNAMRSRFKTDWAFTAFVADMSYNYRPDPPRPDPGCWAGGGFVAYAYLGGPYMVIPYPACRYGYGLGYGRVFIHEMSHIFWALDEYASAQVFCTERSGYLDVPTLNTLFQPELCRTTPVPCIMQTASPPFEPPLPICETTQGQVGLAAVEIGPVTVPAIYAVPPEIEFLAFPGLSVDTLLPNEDYPLALRVTNAAVPNKNPKQEPTYRISYAPALKSGEISINRAPFEPVSPSTGPWDSSREDIGMDLPRSRFQPGANTLTLRVKNQGDLEAVATKEIFAIGLKYHFITVEPDTDRINLSWTTPGEVFGAVFKVMRADHTTGERHAVIATVSEPEVTASDRRVYAFDDTLAKAGHRYGYRIVGAFGIHFRGEYYSYEFPSHDVTVTAMIPLARGALVSNLLPNPTNSTSSFTIDVPRTFKSIEDSRVAPVGSPARFSPAAAEVLTPVKVVIYNVLGQRLRTLYSNSRYGGIMSLTWDGADDRGSAVPAGVYFLSVTAGGRSDVRKIVVVR